MYTEMEQMQVYKEYLNMLAKGHVNSVLCYSKAGLGKTYTTIKMLKQLGIEYRYESGVSTPVALYKLLYNTNGKVLVIDDIETIFQDDRIINLLKGALWDVDGKRYISYNTSSKVLEDYPGSFEYTGRIIILANEIKGRNDESFKALMSRTLKYELKYTFDEVRRISHGMIEERTDINDNSKQLAINIIDNRIEPYHNFNFRLLERLIAFIKYDSENAEELFIKSLDKDEDLEIITNIIKRNKKVKDQVREYKELTDGSRMTFFRRKKRLKDEGLIII